MVGRKLLCILYQLSNLNLITYMYHFLKDNIFFIHKFTCTFYCNFHMYLYLNTHAVNNRLHIEIQYLNQNLFTAVSCLNNDIMEQHSIFVYI